MADEQAQTASTDSRSVDQTAPASPSPPDERGSSDGSPSWWQRLMGRRPVEETGTPADERPDATAGGQASTRLSLTPEELDRRVQAETDRREAKRKAEAEAQARRKLRDDDPWAYAEQERQAEQVGEQNVQIEQLFSTIGAEHDRHTIDPVMAALPKGESERILALEGAGRGLEGRKLIVGEALKALEKHWKAEGEREAEAKLRKNSAFRKQVFAEFRGQISEPELLPSGSARGNGRGSQDINDMLRAQVGMRTSE